MTDYRMIAEKIAPIALKHGVERVSLFGSRARGEERKDSDYDLLIQKGRVTTLWKLAALWDDLEDALQAPVDIVTYGTPDRELFHEAKRDEVLLYEQERSDDSGKNSSLLR